MNYMMCQYPNVVFAEKFVDGYWDKCVIYGLKVLVFNSDSEDLTVFSFYKLGRYMSQIKNNLNEKSLII